MDDEKEGDSILTCKLGKEMINCFDGQHDKEQLKKWAQKSILLCPVCDKPYEYCHGKVKIPYFRHKDKVQCEYNYAEPETEEHLNGKRDLYMWLCKQKDVADVVLEGWLPETHQRPDLMFTYNGEKWVIEYQCSPIATEYFERHELYQAAGIHDIWICGTEKYMKDNMRDKVIEQYCAGYYDTDSRRFIFPLGERKYSDLLKLVSNHNKTNGKKMQVWLQCSTYPARFRKYFAVELNGMTFCNGTMVVSKLPLESDISDISMRISKRNKMRGSLSSATKYGEGLIKPLNIVYSKHGFSFEYDNSMPVMKLCVTYSCSGSIGVLKKSERYQLPKSHNETKRLLQNINNLRHKINTAYDVLLMDMDYHVVRAGRTIHVEVSHNSNKIVDEIGFVWDIMSTGIFVGSWLLYTLPHYVIHRNGQTIDFTKVSDDYIKRVFKNIGFEDITVFDIHNGLEEIG